MQRPPLRRSILIGLLSALAFCGAFVAGGAGRPFPAYLDDGWRGWDDLAVASGYFRDGAFPVAPYFIGNRYRRQSPEFKAFRRPIVKAFKDRPVTDAWVKVDPVELMGGRTFPVTQFADPGRAFFLGVFFRLTGGIRPLFLLWLPKILAAATLGWMAFELSLRRHLVASLAASALFALSAFFREASVIGYSAYGFCFAAGFALVAFSVAMSARPTVAHVWPRLAAASLVLSVAILARNAAWLTAPAFLVAWAFGACGTGSWKRRLGLLSLGFVALFLAPALMSAAVNRLAIPTTPAQIAARASIEALGGPGPWPYLWVGLGDFDREKGHRYLDQAARETARAGGFGDMMDPGTGKYFRRIIIEEIVDDPSWYAGILLRRLRAALLLEKLWPSARTTGKTFAPAEHPNEGAIDSYMTLAPTADLFGWNGWTVEVPGVLLCLGWPTLFLASALNKAYWGSIRPFRALAPPLLGFIATPVITSTGSTVDLQAMAAVHFLAWAFVADAICVRIASWAIGRARTRALKRD